MPDLNVKETIAKALTGNRFAFRMLVERFQGLVYSIAFRITGNSSEAEDLTQETFIKVWKNLHRYDDRWEFKSWIAKIVSNLCLDYLKSSRRRNEMASTGIEQSTFLEMKGGPSQLLEQRELHDAVIQLAQELTPKQRTVFVLRDLENLEVEEVCKISEMTAEQVKSNLYHARSFMKIRLKQYYKSDSHELHRK